MGKTYSFVVSVDELKRHPNAGISFKVIHDTALATKSAIVNLFTEVDDQIAVFCTTFTNLRKDFHSRLSLTTALFLS
ncbi:hypothetical protein AX14_010382 [Amanita brunnescens Koide BX004]|nr:hypothetical protein AX14_010382 [Amanita brunnescens Koide BX004]